MPIASMQQWEAGGHTTNNYDALVVEMNVREEPPEGLLFHTAGRTPDGGWRIFDVWESREAMQRFMDERLMPAVAKVAQGGGPPDRQEAYELHGWQLGPAA